MSVHDLSLSMVPILISYYYFMILIWDFKLHNSVDMFHLSLKTVLKNWEISQESVNFQLLLKNQSWQCLACFITDSSQPKACHCHDTGSARSTSPALLLCPSLCWSSRAPSRSKGTGARMWQHVSGHTSIYPITHICSFLKNHRVCPTLLHTECIDSFSSIYWGPPVCQTMETQQWKVHREDRTRNINLAVFSIKWYLSHRMVHCPQVTECAWTKRREGFVSSFHAAPLFIAIAFSWHFSFAFCNH